MENPVILILKYTLLESYSSVLYHQKLIDKWSDPEDLAQRAAVIIRDIHKMYGRVLFRILKNHQINCKHPKKLHAILKKKKYCTNCHIDLGKSNVKNKL